MENIVKEDTAKNDMNNYIGHFYKPRMTETTDILEIILKQLNLSIDDFLKVKETYNGFFVSNKWLFCLRDAFQCYWFGKYKATLFYSRLALELYIKEKITISGLHYPNKVKLIDLMGFVFEENSNKYKIADKIRDLTNDYIHYDLKNLNKRRFKNINEAEEVELEKLNKEQKETISIMGKDIIMEKVFAFKILEYWSDLLKFDKKTLLRLFYLDTFMACAGDNLINIEENELEERFTKVNEESEELTIEEIKERILKNNPKDENWMKRYENKKYDKLIVNPFDLVTDGWHGSFLGEEGTLLKSKLKEVMEDSEHKKRFDGVKKHYNFLKKNLPVIIGKYNQTYKVMMGTHRVLVAIEKRERSIQALCVKDKS